jgi:hypothetical protein
VHPLEAGSTRSVTCGLSHWSNEASDVVPRDHSREAEAAGTSPAGRPVVSAEEWTLRRDGVEDLISKT